MAACGDRVVAPTTGRTVAEFGPAWTPEGRLLFARTGDDGSSALLTINPDGTGLRVLARLGAGSDAQVSAVAGVSPDGRSIALTMYFPGLLSGRLGVVDVGGGTIRILPTEMSDACPAWSPDGRRLAYVSRLGARSNGVIYAVDPDGANRVRLSPFEVMDATTRGVDGCPVYTPDGHAILFPTHDGLWAMNPDGTNRRQLTPETWRMDPDIALSPDGRTLAFTDGGGAGAGIRDLFVRPLAGGPARQLVVLEAGRYLDTAPAWSADGSRLAFSVATDSQELFEPHESRLYVVNADGTGLAEVPTGRP
jgi:Tol biopolymer transport system component